MTTTWYTASAKVPNVMDFSDPASVPDTALFSFHPLVFLYFILSFIIVPYPIYRRLAKKYNWETNHKSVARHWSDIMLAFSYGLILFIFGNYSKAYSWITVVAFYPSLFGYALIAELPFTKTSLPNIKNWPKGMWIVFLVALAVILAFAAVHIYFASQLALPFVIYYVCGLLIPAFFLVVSILIKKEVNKNWTRSIYHRFRVSRLKRHYGATAAPANRGEVANEADVIENVAAAAASNTKSPSLKQEEEDIGGGTTTAVNTTEDQQQLPSLKNPYTQRVNLHIHHWQIFYVLAFFTRFTHPISQVAAGIVIACYMQGICAYGYDPLINDG